MAPTEKIEPASAIAAPSAFFSNAAGKTHNAKNIASEPIQISPVLIFEDAIEFKIAFDDCVFCKTIAEGLAPQPLFKISLGQPIPLDDGSNVSHPNVGKRQSPE
ncbi:MAG TPA: hypothetical protein VGF44_05965 [Terriglobales bacterium]|jgi:hypothetical protein